MTLAQTRAIRNQRRGRATGLRAALRELRAQRTQKPHHRFNHFEDLHAEQALSELEARLEKLLEAASVAAPR